MWLVFHDEGVSLRHYLYTEREATGFVLHGQSAFWRDMRLDPKGPEVSDAAAAAAATCTNKAIKHLSRGTCPTSGWSWVACSMFHENGLSENVVTYGTGS